MIFTSNNHIIPILPVKQRVRSDHGRTITIQAIFSISQNCYQNGNCIVYTYLQKSLYFIKGNHCVQVAMDRALCVPPSILCSIETRNHLLLRMGQVTFVIEYKFVPVSIHVPTAINNKFGVSDASSPLLTLRREFAMRMQSR